MTARQRRIRRHNAIGIAIMLITGLPVIAVLVIGAALSMAGCHSPDIVCVMPWEAAP